MSEKMGLDKVEAVLTEVKKWLVDAKVTAAVTAVKAVGLPIGKLSEELVKLVELIRDALNKILDKIDDVTNKIGDLQALLKSIETLLDTAKGLDLDVGTALAIVKTLKSVPTKEDINKVLDEIIGTTDKPDTILYILSNAPYK